MIWISGLILRDRPAFLRAGDKFLIGRLDLIFLCRWPPAFREAAQICGHLTRNHPTRFVGSRGSASNWLSASIRSTVDIENGINVSNSARNTNGDSTWRNAR